jgi:GR25 family glycosyltransferase involved in LPS biosynthesis
LYCSELLDIIPYARVWVFCSMKNIFKISIFLLILITSGLSYFYILNYNSSDTEVVDNGLPNKFYLINLDRQNDRWELISEQFAKYKISLERFSATDGFLVAIEDADSKERFAGADLTAKLKHLDADRNYNIYCDANNSMPSFTYSFDSSRPPLTAGEFGLKCSTIRLWSKIKESNEIALVFEDDIQLFGAFDRHIEEILAALPNKWDLVYLDNSEHNVDSAFFMQNLRTINNHLLKLISGSKKHLYDSYAYIINSNSARKLLNFSNNYSDLTVEEILYKAINNENIVALIAKNKILGLKKIQSEIDMMGRWEKNDSKQRN